MNSTWMASASGISSSCAASQLAEQSVAALFACVMGESDDSDNGRAPPSVRELLELGPAKEPFALQATELTSLLDEGLAALDEAAIADTGQPFWMIDRTAQLRAVFRLESGRTSLGGRRAATFINAFLALAAEACLRTVLKEGSH